MILAVLMWNINKKECHLFLIYFFLQKYIVQLCNLCNKTRNWADAKKVSIDFIIKQWPMIVETTDQQD